MNNYNKNIKYYLADTCKNIKSLKKGFERITYNLAKYIDFVDKEVSTKFIDSHRDEKLRMLIETLISGIHDSIIDISCDIKPPFMFYLQNYEKKLLNISDFENLLINEDIKKVLKQIILHEFNIENLTVTVEKINNINITFTLHFDLEHKYISEDIKFNLNSYLVRLLSLNFDLEENNIEISYPTDGNEYFTIIGNIHLKNESPTEPDIIGNAKLPTYDIGFGGNYSYRMNIANSNISPWYENGNLPILHPIKFNMKKYILNKLNFNGSNTNEVGFINAFGDVIFYIPGIQILYDPIKITLKIKLTTITESNILKAKKDIFKYFHSSDDDINWFISEWTPHIKNINDIGLILYDDNYKFNLTDEEIELEQKLREKWNEMNEKLTNNNDMHYLLANLSNYITKLDKYIDFIQKRRFVCN